VGAGTVKVAPLVEVGGSGVAVAQAVSQPSIHTRFINRIGAFI
jgi:hypothetical protein